jgi:hypothetical protein
MISRKASVIFAAAVFIALAIALFSKPPPYVEQLIRIQAEQEFGHIDKAITNEPLEVQGMLLDYEKWLRKSEQRYKWKLLV